MRRWPFRLRWLVVWAACCHAAGSSAADPTTRPAPPEPIQYGPPKQVCELANKRISESSGVACSRLAKDVFWTHNDSGDAPRVYAFDAAGKDLGTFAVQGATAADWEDMCSFAIGGRGFLLLADVGDNDRRRQTCDIYIVREPAVRKSRQREIGQVKAGVKITFAYEDGPHDCESVAVDAKSRKIYLASKESPSKAGVYELPLLAKSTRKVLKARAIAKVPLAYATAMDISPEGSRAVILSGAAYEYTRAAGQTWAEAFSRPGRAIPMPPRRQGESICYGPGGESLYLTSEGVPTPLWLVPAAEGK